MYECVHAYIVVRREKGISCTNCVVCMGTELYMSIWLSRENFLQHKAAVEYCKGHRLDPIIKASMIMFSPGKTSPKRIWESRKFIRQGLKISMLFSVIIELRERGRYTYSYSKVTHTITHIGQFVCH